MFAQDHILCDGKFLDHAIAHALLGNVGKHAVGQVAGSEAGNILAFEYDLSACNFAQAGNGFSQFALAVARHTCYPQYLAGTHFKTDIAQTWRAAITST